MAKESKKKKAATADIASATAEIAPISTSTGTSGSGTSITLIVDLRSKLPPFRDDVLHPQIVEALKNLEVASDAYQRALDNIDGQFLKSIDHGATADQVAAVRAKF